MNLSCQFSLLPILGISVLGGAADEEALSVHELAPFETKAEWQDDSNNSLSVATGSYQAATPLEASTSLGVALDSAVGVHMQRRSANALEPNVHGLGADRVDVYWNGIYLPNASPTQTASALNALGPGTVDRVSVFPLISPVALGPLSAGARIELTSHPLLRKQGDRTGILFDFNGNLRQAWATLGRTNASAAYRIFAYGNRSEDYEAGDGAIVDADFESRGLAFSAAKQLNTRHQLNLSSIVQETANSRNVSLPLDTRSGNFFAASIAHRYSFFGSDSFLRTKIGFSRNRHNLDNADRASAPILVSANADTRSLSAGFSYHSTLSTETHFQAGIDFISEKRNATRFRHTPSAIREDRLWPGINSENLGLFVQIASSNRPSLQWRTGARLDHRRTQARDTDAPAIVNGTVLDNYLKYNGASANATTRTDSLGGINGELTWSPNVDSKFTFGGGIARSAPSTTHRYRAFVNALGGGFEVGNPALSPETNVFVKAQFEQTSERIDLRASVFAKRIQDFIVREKVADLGPDPVFGFRNAEVEFRGLDLGAALYPYGKDTQLILPIAFSLVEGNHRQDDRDLAEVPPWEGRIGLEYAGPGFWWNANLRIAGSRRNPAPEITPIFEDVSGYAILDLKAGFKLSPHSRLELKLANLFDASHYSYLQPPVTAGTTHPSSGTLAPGDPIPQPGRSLSLRLEYDF